MSRADVPLQGGMVERKAFSDAGVLCSVRAKQVPSRVIKRCPIPPGSRWYSAVRIMVPLGSLERSGILVMNRVISEPGIR